MPAASDLKLYGAASFPEDDVSTAGGAITTTTKLEFTQFSAAAVAELVSNGADTRTVTVVGRLASGALDTEAIVLNGATPVAGAKTWERILKVTTTSDAARTVDLRQGVSGTVRLQILPLITKVIALFKDSTSETGVATRYEKGHFKNQHATTALLAASVKLTGDPAARCKIGVATAKGDTVTVANRKTAPGGVTFVDDNVAAAVPTDQLGAGENIGVWVEQTLPASDPATKSTVTLELSGSSI